MSRGPGKWQRLILEELERPGPGWIYLRDILREDEEDYWVNLPTKAQMSALGRAARRLADLGLIKVSYQWRPRQYHPDISRSLVENLYPDRRFYPSAHVFVSRLDSRRGRDDYGMPFGPLGRIRSTYRRRR